VRRLVAFVLLVATLSLVGCVQGTPSPAPKPTTAPPASLTPTTTAAPALLPATPTPTPTPSATPTPTSTPTTLPSPTLTPSPSPTPTPLPVSAAGEPLPFFLGSQFNANGHLTAGIVTEWNGQTVYLLASLGRSVYALDGRGKVQWQAKTRGPVYALAVLDGERIAAGDDAGDVTLLDSRGKRLWRTPLGSRVTALHPYQDGLLAGGWDERLTFLDGDGEIRWQFPVHGPVSDITTLQDRIVVATLDGWIYGLLAAGLEAWHSNLQSAVTRLEGVEGVGVLIGIQAGRLLAVDSQGTILWQWPSDAGVEGSPVWHAVRLSDEPRPDVIAGSGGRAPVLARLSPAGEVRWQVALPAPVAALSSADLDADGSTELAKVGRPEILAGLSSGKVLAFDEEGRQRGAAHARLPVWGLDVSADGRSVFVRADVVAWQLYPGDGPAGEAWLPPPALLPAPPESLSAGTARADGEAILVFLGDVSPGRSMEAHLARYGPAYPWAGLARLLADADLAMANLEGVLTTQGQPLDKSYLIRAHPRWGQTLVAAGLDLVTLANNHALDFGDAGLDETLDVLAGLDVAVVGAGRSREEARRPAIFDLGGGRVAVLSYAAARWNGSVDVPATGRIAWADPEDVAADVRAVCDDVSLVVVVLHAGTEYAGQPAEDQVAVAHAAIDAGAGLVVGHHPHATQTVERYHDGLIVYSLGDALFDIPRPAAMRGHLLRVHVTGEGLAQAELWPFWIDAEQGYQLRLLDGGQGEPRVRIIYP
jgi:poly-gamma-glutamate capsule biosynthesis protein CapA/YwtB (metallophosphatase superfamily)